MCAFYREREGEGERERERERVRGPLMFECRSSAHNRPVSEAEFLPVTFSPHVAFSFRDKWA